MLCTNCGARPPLNRPSRCARCGRNRWMSAAAGAGVLGVVGLGLTPLVLLLAAL